MPISQHATTTSAAIFNTEPSAPLVDLETSSVMAPASTGISPLLILSTMVKACFIAFVTITDRAIRADSIKIDPRRYCFKTMCPTSGNIRAARSAAFIDLVTSSSCYLTLRYCQVNKLGNRKVGMSAVVWRQKRAAVGGWINLSTMVIPHSVRPAHAFLLT